MQWLCNAEQLSQRGGTIPGITSLPPEAPIHRRRALEHLALAVVGLSTRGLPRVYGQRPMDRGRAGPRASVTYLDAAALRRVIRTAPEENAGHPGMYSLTLSDGTGYPVTGIRRTAPARSELHATASDVWYVLQGSATLVTGGTMVDGIDTETGEVRGSRIAGGDVRQLRTGDFAVIPAGVPHWVKRIATKEFLYLVVKVPLPV
jgi:mannose-6-phosphate isomerase-like protein (cupin superfamily)